MSEVEKKLADLRKQADKLATERTKLEKMIADAKAEAAQIVPMLNAQLAEQDKIVAEATARRTEIMTQLKLFGLKVAVIGARGERAGGLKDKFRELLSTVGVGATLTNSDIGEHLGTSSGYVGMIISEAVKTGSLKRTQPGTYEVVSTI